MELERGELQNQRSAEVQTQEGKDEAVTKLFKDLSDGGSKVYKAVSGIRSEMDPQMVAILNSEDKLLARNLEQEAYKMAASMHELLTLMQEKGMADTAAKTREGMIAVASEGPNFGGETSQGPSQIEGGGAEAGPSKVEGGASQGAESKGRGEEQSQGQAVEGRSGEGSGGGGNPSLPEVESLANVPSPSPAGDPFVAVEAGGAPVWGTVSYTHNFAVLVRDRHHFSFGLQGRCSVGGRGIANPGLFLQFDTRMAAQAYSPLMADGRGSNQRFEFHCCRYGLKLEQGRIFPVREGAYSYKRCGFVLPALSGADGSTGIPVARLIPSRLKGLLPSSVNFNPIIKLKAGSVEPYLIKIQGQGVTGGLGIGQLQGSLELWEQWYVPNIRLLGNLVAGRRVNDRGAAPQFQVSPKTQPLQDLQIQLLNQKVEKVTDLITAMDSRVAQLGMQQQVALFGHVPSLVQKLKGGRKRKGVITQIEELGLSAQSDRQAISRQVRQGFEQSEDCCTRQGAELQQIRDQIREGFRQSEDCCTRQDAQLKQIDRRLHQGVNTWGADIPKLFGIGQVGIVVAIVVVVGVVGVVVPTTREIVVKAAKAVFGRRGGSNSND